jgi:predicted CopG family antitoxin
MKRIALAAALAACAGAAFAQQPPSSDVPAHSCGAKPEYPGRLVMTSDLRRRAFDRELKTYSDCMKAYVESRKKAADANMAAGNAAIEEYNSVIKKIKDEEEAASSK